MKNLITIFSALIMTMGIANSALASSKYDNMVGTWKWEDFTIQVKKCDQTGVCAKVISGPKNVGMQMIKSKLVEAGDNFVGKVAHPQPGPPETTVRHILHCQKTPHVEHFRGNWFRFE